MKSTRDLIVKIFGAPPKKEVEEAPPEEEVEEEAIKKEEVEEEARKKKEDEKTGEQYNSDANAVLNYETIKKEDSFMDPSSEEKYLGRKWFYSSDKKYLFNNNNRHFLNTKWDNTSKMWVTTQPVVKELGTIIRLEKNEGHEHLSGWGPPLGMSLIAQTKDNSPISIYSKTILIEKEPLSQSGSSKRRRKIKKLVGKCVRRSPQKRHARKLK